MTQPGYYHTKLSQVIKTKVLFLCVACWLLRGNYAWFLLIWSIRIKTETWQAGKRGRWEDLTAEECLEVIAVCDHIFPFQSVRMLWSTLLIEFLSRYSPWKIIHILCFFFKESGDPWKVITGPFSHFLDSEYLNFTIF